MPAALLRVTSKGRPGRGRDHGHRRRAHRLKRHGLLAEEARIKAARMTREVWPGPAPSSHCMRSVHCGFVPL